MRELLRCSKRLFLLCVGLTIFSSILATFVIFLGEKANTEVLTKKTERGQRINKELLRSKLIVTTSVLGRWLLSSEGSLVPPIINKKKGPYLILIWKYGKFLERRHIKRFTNNKFSPWENCTVKCILSYQSEDLNIADAVVFHLHLTRNVLELPTRTRWNQRWIFLTDESPIHTFLYASLQQWIENKKRTIWFRVHLPQSEWIPLLVKEGFKFHHAKQEYVMLYRWLVIDEECNIPHYAHTNLGVGGFVYNVETEEILLVKEKYTNHARIWKLPGGYVEPGENLADAVKREVLEETGVQTTFKCILGFRHVHGYSFGCSDIYMVAYLSPVNCNIKKCEREISECRWMKINDYLEHSEVSENSKQIAKTILEFFKHKMGIVVNQEIHFATNKPIFIYSISKVNA